MGEYFCKCIDPPECILSGCQKIPITTQIILWICFLPLRLLPNIVMPSTLGEVTIIAKIILMPIYYYLISCATIYIYSQFKKKVISLIRLLSA